MGGGPEFDSKPKRKAADKAPLPNLAAGIHHPISDHTIHHGPFPPQPKVNGLPQPVKKSDVAEQLAKLKERRAELMAERQAIVQTYEQQLTQLEDQRKELVQKCPHAKMLYGIYNQCADCEEWF